MRPLARLALVLGLLASLLGLPRRAHAGYCLNDPNGNGTYLRWPGASVSYHINTGTLSGFPGGAAAR